MITTTLMVVLVIAIVIAGVMGYWLGARTSKAMQDLARSEGRSESSVEVARLQERVRSTDEQLTASSSRAKELEQELKEATEKGLELETQVARLSERASKLPELEANLQAATASTKETVERLSEQREEASKQKSRADGLVEAQATQYARIEELSALEKALRQQLAQKENEYSEQREVVGKLTADLASLSSAREELRGQISTIEQTLNSTREELALATNQITELQTTLNAQQDAAKEVAAGRDELVAQFKALSAEILEEKSKKFAEQNVASMGQLLAPVKETFSAFTTKFEEVYRTDGKERAALGEQLKQLVQQSQVMSVETQNLTRALKGDQKTQGTWGEIVLDKVLEQAGLSEGTHFDRQTSFVDETQKKQIPDIVLRLPGDRQLVIDSKVSLTAYERASSAGTDEERGVFLKQHVVSVKNHIKGLSERNYQQLYQLKSLDFVLLFVPLEPAFASAISNDNELFREAWDRNVLVVSPSTLLFVVRTVAYLWRQETQAQNVKAIAKRGAALYEKLCGFVDDLQEVGKHIKKTHNAYEAAVRKLAQGDGNAIRQAEMLKEMGVKPSKQLPAEFVDLATEKADLPTLSVETLAETGEQSDPPALPPASASA